MRMIAEIGINHNGDIETAKKLIDVACVAGFDYVKFQKRTPSICVPEDQKEKPKSTPWGEMTYLEYKEKIEFWTDEYNEIFRYSRERGIKAFASAWDIPAAEFMTEYSEIVKIPSAKITDIKLIKYCRENFGYLMISTGMSTEREIEAAFEAGRPDMLFHTNSCYPSPVNEINLDYISFLKAKYKLPIGYSGHEWGLPITYAAVAYGIEWIERHITLDHSMWGSDQKASLDSVGCIKLVRSVRDIEKAMGGCGERKLGESEKEKRKSLR